MGKDDVLERLGVTERGPDAALEVVERGHRGDGDSETDGGGDQRLGDGPHDVAARRAAEAGTLQLVKRLHDSDHRAEQTHERRVVAERAEE
jgi:hypothetical protein